MVESFRGFVNQCSTQIFCYFLRLEVTTKISLHVMSIGQLARRGLTNTMFLTGLDGTSSALLQHFQWHLVYSVQWEI